MAAQHRTHDLAALRVGFGVRHFGDHFERLRAAAQLRAPSVKSAPSVTVTPMRP
jgi:hypothetical protein